MTVIIWPRGPCFRSVLSLERQILLRAALLITLSRKGMQNWRVVGVLRQYGAKQKVDCSANALIQQAGKLTYAWDTSLNCVLGEGKRSTGVH